VVITFNNPATQWRPAFQRTITLTEVIVSSVGNQAADGDDGMGEQVTLNYSKIKIEQPGATVEYDLSTDKLT
jgi:type VI protein secretion system component Hcp